jgi:hypothetical protein
MGAIKKSFDILYCASFALNSLVLSSKLVVDNDGTESFLVAFPLPVVLNIATLSI